MKMSFVPDKHIEQDSEDLLAFKPFVDLIENATWHAHAVCVRRVGRLGYWQNVRPQNS